MNNDGPMNCEFSSNVEDTCTLHKRNTLFALVRWITQRQKTLLHGWWGGEQREGVEAKLYRLGRTSRRRCTMTASSWEQRFRRAESPSSAQANVHICRHQGLVL